MQKSALVIIAAVIFGVLGFAFAKFCPLVSAKTVTVSQVLAINSSDELRPLHESKTAELAKLLEQMTDADSARKHRPAAERTYVELQLMGARSRMFTSTGASQSPAVSADHPISQIKTQLQRIAKSEDIQKELTPSLTPLFRDYQISLTRDVNPSALLISQVQTTRSQIELYKFQHADNYPDFRKYGWKQLTYKTNTTGQIREGNIRPPNAHFGPYLMTPPQNPLTKSSEVLVVPSIPDGFKAPGSYGYIFDESRGRIFALATDGTLFDESSASADTR